MKVMILAGGGGTRLWPLSRQRFPKQFLSLFPNESHSLLSATIKRALAAVDDNAANVFVSTSEQLLEPVLTDLRNAGFDDVMHQNVLLEPCMRNTGPAIAFTAQYIFENASSFGDDEVLAILPADHHIADVEDFASQLKHAETLAKQGYIVTLGILPDRPETGYGYIELDGSLEASANKSDTWHVVNRFVEKPNLDKAQEYVASQRYLWNAGIFVLSFKTLRDSLASHSPEISNILNQGYQAAYAAYGQMPNISFDYAVMEHSKNTAVIPLRSQWSDIGSWDSLYAILSKDEANNATSHPEETVFHNSSNCMVKSTTKRRVNVLGLSDCFVVDTPDALLIGHMDASQDVKSIVAELNAANHGSVHTPSSHSQLWGELMHLNVNEPTEAPVHRLVLKAGQTVSIVSETLSDTTCSLQVLSGLGILYAAGSQKVVDYPFATVLNNDLVLLRAENIDLTCLIVGQAPTIQRFNEDALNDSSEIFSTQSPSKALA